MKEKNRKIKVNFTSEEIEIIFEETIQKIRCCELYTHNNKYFFSMNINDSKGNYFLNSFIEKFISFFHEI